MDTRNLLNSQKKAITLFMDDKKQGLYINTLLLLQSFEKYWMLNYLSKGSLFKGEVNGEAEKLCSLLNQLEVKEPDGANDAFYKLKTTIEKDIIGNKQSEQKLIDDKEGFYRQLRSLIISVQTSLYKILNIALHPSIVHPAGDGVTEQQISEWLGQVHPAMISQMDGVFADSMSQSDTIAIVADIRRSQDLMTYSSSEIYSSKIIEFTGAVKDIILTSNGIFDKFTGDGFIAYYNKHMCETNGSDYYNQMWYACVRIMEYANSFFEEWSKLLRKVPEENIGLSIGVDSGKILFTILDHQVFAVGEPCVWATRMSSSGHSGEIIFNNIPYHHIQDCHLGLNFQKIESMTKTGEKFKCNKVCI